MVRPFGSECLPKLQWPIPLTPGFWETGMHTLWITFAHVGNSQNYLDWFDTESVLAQIRSRMLERIVNQYGGYGDETL